MEESNELFNIVLKAIKENDINKEGVKKCKEILQKLSEKDEIALKVYLYFYPDDSTLNEKDDEFWFIKFKNDNIYDEYDFALDLLKGYIQYISSKDKKFFESYIIEKIKSFKNYKFIDKFFSVIKDYEDKIIATISYITKDQNFLLDNFNLITPPENIQTYSSITAIKRYLYQEKLSLELEKEEKKLNKFLNEWQEKKTLREKLLNETGDLRNNNENILTKLNKIENDDKIMKIENNNLIDNNIILKNENNNLINDNIILKNDNNNIENYINIMENDNNSTKNDMNNLIIRINNLENENEKLRKNQTIMQSNIQNISEKINSLSQKIESMNERLEKIELRDNLKISFRYLYKVLKSKFPNDVQDVTETSQQIKEVKKILSMPQFKPNEFILEFINNNQLDKLLSYSSNYTQEEEDK